MEESKHRKQIMATQSSKSNIFWFSSACVLVVLLAFVDVGLCQNCGCNGLCCSQYGYCGTGAAYCGAGCKEGPCTSSPSTPTPSGGGGVSSIVSSDVFNFIVGGAASGCAGNGFYTYDSFIDAANAFTRFGTSGASDVNKREIAAFFGNAAHETGGFCYIEEQNPGSKYCDASNTEYPCNPDKSYHGRGPLQLSCNYNYGAAGKYLQFDGLNNPEIVGTNSTISFKTAMWFWMVKSQCHTAITSGEGLGFGGTISMECNGGNDAAVSSRVNYFQKFCQQLNVDPGSNLRCGQENIQKPIQKSEAIYLRFVLI